MDRHGPAACHAPLAASLTAMTDLLSASLVFKRCVSATDYEGE